jgi:hypothetical protein
MKNTIIVLLLLSATTTTNAQNRVGIGISTPLYPLHLSNAANGPIAFSISNAFTGQGIADGTQIGYLQGNSNDFTISNQENGNLTLATNLGSSYVRLTPNGRVGIGTFNPGAQLHIHENSSNPVGVFFSNTFTQNQVGNSFFVGYGFANQPHVDIYNYQNGDLRLGTNAGNRMIIKANGNVGIATMQPNHRFEVEGNSHFSGNLGIYKANPQHALDVNGDAFVSGSIRRLPTTRTITFGPAAFHSTLTSGPYTQGADLDLQPFGVNVMHDNLNTYNFLDKLAVGGKDNLGMGFRTGYAGFQLFLPNAVKIKNFRLKTSNLGQSGLPGSFQLIVTRTPISVTNTTEAQLYYVSPIHDFTSNHHIFKDSQKIVSEFNVGALNLSIQNEAYIYAVYLRFVSAFGISIDAVDWLQISYETAYHSE